LVENEDQQVAEKLYLFQCKKEAQAINHAYNKRGETEVQQAQKKTMHDQIRSSVLWLAEELASPYVGLEPTTTRLRVARSTN
jgi:hypothetical protein